MKIIHVCLGVVVATCSWLVPPASATDMTAAEIAASMQRKYESTANITANFLQTTTMAFNNRTRQGKGRVAIEKSGRMRWDYREPDEQVLVSDGKLFSMYIAKDKQLIRGDASQYLESDITYAFLSGSGDVQRDFEIQLLDGNDASQSASSDGYHIKLTPKKAHPQVDYLELWVNRATFLMDRILMVDHFGSVTDLKFSDVRVNQLIADGLFSFSPPSGTEIINQ